MGGSGGPAADRCRESHNRDYDDYYATVLLSVGLKDAFGDGEPCSFKVSEPTMYTAASRKVNPDAIFQCDGDTRGVVCEIKSSLPRGLSPRPDLGEQIGKYAEIREGWKTNTGRIEGHSVLLLVRRADMGRACDMIYGAAGGGPVPAESLCLGHWEQAKARGPGAGDVIRLSREMGSTGCEYFDGRLDDGIEIPVEDTLAGYERRRFVRADPPDLYMLTTLYQNVLPGIAGDSDGCRTVSIEGLGDRMAEYYASWSGLEGERGQVRPRWIRRALDTLLRMGLANRLPDGRYRISPPPRRQRDVMDFLLDRLCGSDGPWPSPSDDQSSR